MRIRFTAAVELVLLSPALLFMAALVARNLQPLQYDLARAAQQLVMWYAGRMWTLWVLLLALPFIVLISGCATLLNRRDRSVELPHTARAPFAVVRANPATLFAAATTLAAACILMIVVLHMLAN